MKKKSIIILFCSILIVNFLLSSSFPNLFIKLENSTEIIPISPNSSGVKKTLSENANPNYRTNIFQNGEMEEFTSGEPDHFDSYGTSYEHHDAQYTNEVANGSYAGLLESRSNNLSSAQAYMYASPNSNLYTTLDQMLNLSFYYNITTKGIDPSSYINLRIIFSNGRQIYYVLYTESASFSNSTSIKYLLTNDTSTNTWNKFERNITLDYINLHSASINGIYIDGMYYYAYTGYGTYAQNRIIIDSVAITNNTNYNFLEARNGDFELGTGGYWYGSNSDEAFIDKTTERIDGNYALNMTTQVSGVASSTSSLSLNKNFNFPEGPTVTDEKSCLLEFDWNYMADYEEYGSHAQYYIYLRNSSHFIYLYFELSTSDSNPYYTTNQTTGFYQYFYMKDKNFGQRNTWVKTKLDLYELFTDFSTSLNLFDMVITTIGINIETTSIEQVSISLLIDNFHLRTYPVIDPFFSQTWYSSRPFVSWNDNGADTNLNRTTFSHSGSWAANISLSGSTLSRHFYRNNLYFNVKNDVYTNFWWYLSSFSGTNCYSYIYFVIDSSKILYYITLNTAITLHNNSDTVYYYVENANTTGSWFNIRRNLFDDITSYFGENNWNVTGLYFGGGSFDGSSNLNIFYDDLNFIEFGKPIIENVSLINTPKYYQEAIVEFDAFDELSDLYTLDLYYTNDSAWNKATITTIDENSFRATIPVFDAGENIRFFLNASDEAGNVETNDNGGSYYSYVVLDDVEPLVSFLSPYNNSLLTDTVSLKLNTADAGSGVAFVELYANLTLIANITEQPFEYLWNTREMANGLYKLKAIAYDSFGNFKSTSDSFYVTIENDLTPPLLSGIQINPANPEYGEDVRVTVGVYEESEIENCTLYYKIEDGTWVSLSMTADGVVFYADIPAQNWGITVYYYAQAYDIYGQKSLLGSSAVPYHFTVEDRTLPSLVIEGPPSSTVLSGDNVEFWINGSDAGSGVKVIEVEINGSIWSTTSLQTTYVLDTTSLENGQYTLTFRIFDNAENEYSISYSYEIYNPKGFAKFWSAIDSTLNSYYGMIVGAGAVILAYGTFMIVRFFTKRKSS